MTGKTSERPIAVIDSGIGGISVLKELIKQLPGENFLFFGDEANAPYGTKTCDEVKKITFNNVRRLVDEENIKILVIACNTATGVAAASLRASFRELPIIGVEPEIKTAALLPGHPKILIMATPLTLAQQKFLKLRDRYSCEADFTLLPCPGLMELIEKGSINDLRIEKYLEKLFNGMDCSSYDAVVLGCTHYPHIKSSIMKYFPGKPVFDGCAGTAAEAKRRLEAAGLAGAASSKGSVRFVTTADNPGFEKLCKYLLGGSNFSEN